MTSRADTSTLLSRLTTLGDLARLRVLRLLDREELSVGELARALQLPQSTVSRHLKVLHDAGWIVKRTEGTASLYCLVAGSLDEEAAELWALVRRQTGPTATLDEDDSRLHEVIAARRTDGSTFFGRLGSDWVHLRGELFGPAFTADALLGLVPSAWTVADLGCGTGDGAELLAPVVKSIIAVDREPAMLDAARRRLEDWSNVEFRQGNLTELPLADGEVQAAMILLVAVYLEDPARAVREAARVIEPGGPLLIVDMVAHDRESYRHTMGHLHLGFGREEVDAWADAGGFGHVRYRRLRPDTNAKGPGLFAAVMRKG